MFSTTRSEYGFTHTHTHKHQMSNSNIWAICMALEMEWNEHADEVNKINGAKSDNTKTPSILQEIPLPSLTTHIYRKMCSTHPVKDRKGVNFHQL